MKKLTIYPAFIAILLGTGATLAGCQSQPDKVKVTVKTKTVTKKNHDDLDAAKQLEAKNKKTSAKLDKLKKDVAAAKKQLEAKKDAAKHAPAASAAATSQSNGGASSLAKLNYSGTQEITVNGNNPGFTASELSTARGAWESYGNLDSLNRVTVANALLGRKLMPTSERTALTWDPTGWHNKRTAHGWLFNRSHLIGFQLSGENNNPKNLMTGTQTLNTPLMLAHEDDIAAYLKENSRHLVRYQVRPIFRGNELVARGVQMRAQSIGDNTIRFNVYIFNVEAGYTIDYSTGYSHR
nr:DNA/RNA non-specific endonuclease [Lacticaseibacillus hulanensis]